MGVNLIAHFHIDSATRDWVLGEPKFSAGKPLYHLGALTKNPHANIWVVEGEQKADCLEKLGFTATTSGGSSTVLSVDWEPLRGRNIIIWRDFDETGFKYAQEVIKILESLNCTIHCIDVAALNLPERGDIVDWLKMNPDATQQAICDLPLIRNLAVYKDAKHDWPEPLPLTATIQQEPYPLDALPPKIRDAIIEVQSYTKPPFP